jgi:hypothetical protein
VAGKGALFAFEGEGAARSGQGEGDAIVGQAAADPALDQAGDVDHDEVVQIGGCDGDGMPAGCGRTEGRGVVVAERGFSPRIAKLANVKLAFGGDRIDEQAEGGLAHGGAGGQGGEVELEIAVVIGGDSQKRLGSEVVGRCG